MNTRVLLTKLHGSARRHSRWDAGLRVCGSILLVFAIVVFSPDRSFADWEDDFPYAGERNARISLIQGDLMLQRGDDDEWAYAAVNMPLRPYDRLWGTEGARAEIQFSGGSVFRLSEHTSADILALEDNFIQIDITSGTGTFIVRERRVEGLMEVATPQAAIEASDAEFRVDVDREGTTRIVVRSGSVDVESVAGPVRLHDGEELIIRPEDPPTFVVGSAPPLDAWDRWNDERDRQVASAGSRRYVEISDPWVSDLDRYGHWSTVETYGTVWFPSVRVGWAPYSEGRWVWVEPWGWTWVSWEPWGWGPYHYGRWVYVGNRGWGWVPGRRLVWIPGNARFIYGASWVAWAPLGYRDHYHYHSSPEISISFSFSHYERHGGLTVVSNVGFLSGHYHRHRVNIGIDKLRAAGRVAALLPLRPVRRSLYPYVDREVRTVHLPPRYIERSVVHLRTPARVPKAFAERHRVITNSETDGKRVILRGDNAPPRRTARETDTLRRTVIRKSSRGMGVEKDNRSDSGTRQGYRGRDLTPDRKTNGGGIRKQDEPAVRERGQGSSVSGREGRRSDSDAQQEYRRREPVSDRKSGTLTIPKSAQPAVRERRGSDVSSGQDEDQRSEGRREVPRRSPSRERLPGRR